MFRFFDPQDTIECGKGGSLPHWRQDGVIYFVTFRLADSLPQEKLRTLRRERAEWLAQHPPPHKTHETAAFHERFTDRVQQWLDRGYGSRLLAVPEAKSLVEETLWFFEGNRYMLDAFVVASTHVHVLLSPIAPHALSRILQGWKSYSAKMLLKLPFANVLSTAPNVWQKESWDHIVRTPSSLHRFRAYIRAHPEFNA